MSILKDIITKLSCHHQWKVEAKCKVSKRDENFIKNEYVRITYICEKCGEFKQIKV